MSAPTIRELRVTDIRCRAPECRAAPGERCKWDSRRSHQSRIDEHAELVEAGWQWQEVDLDDAGAADRHRERCAKRTLCTRTAGHSGNCTEFPRVDYARKDERKRTAGGG